ncbi:MAG: hypothetical protein ACOCXG_00215 [Nanoarchaeota archaeon]
MGFILDRLPEVGKDFFGVFTNDYFLAILIFVMLLMTVQVMFKFALAKSIFKEKPKEAKFVSFVLAFIGVTGLVFMVKGNNNVLDPKTFVLIFGTGFGGITLLAAFFACLWIFVFRDWFKHAREAHKAEQQDEKKANRYGKLAWFILSLYLLIISSITLMYFNRLLELTSNVDLFQTIAGIAGDLVVLSFVFAVIFGIPLFGAMSAKTNKHVGNPNSNAAIADLLVEVGKDMKKLDQNMVTLFRMFNRNPDDKKSLNNQVKLPEGSLLGGGE